MGSTMKSSTLAVLAAIFIVCCDNKHLLIETEDEVAEEAGTDYSDYQQQGLGPMPPEQLYGDKNWESNHELTADNSCRYSEVKTNCYCCGQWCKNSDDDKTEYCTRFCNWDNIRISPGQKPVIIMRGIWTIPICETRDMKLFE